MIAAYFVRCSMARTLESLAPGTPVFAGATRVGAVTAVYAEGDARAAEIVVVRWEATGEDLAVPAVQVESVTEQGVQLMRTEPDRYDDLVPFDASRYPTMKKLA